MWKKLFKKKKKLLPPPQSYFYIQFGLPARNAKDKKQQRAPLKAHFIDINILHVLHGQAHSAQGLGETALIGYDPSPEKGLSVRQYKENSPLFPSTPHPTASHVSAQLFLLQAGFSWDCRIIPFSVSKAVVSLSNIYL